jgi:hypothetical protein
MNSDLFIFIGMWVGIAAIQIGFVYIDKRKGK